MMEIPNIDLLRTVSSYDASGLPRPGHGTKHHIPCTPKVGRVGAATSFVQSTLRQILTIWEKPISDPLTQFSRTANSRKASQGEI
jgi:hypothetical protein